jgi:hypothetical protein
LNKYIVENSYVHQHNKKSCNNFYIHAQQTVAIKKSVFQSGITEYNKLPNDVKNETKLQTFKKKNF